MSLKSRTLLMSLSSLALAGLLLLGFSFSLTQIGYYKMTRVTTASDGGRDSDNPSLNANGTKMVFHSDSDFLNQGILNDQNEIWLYDITTMTLTRVTTASHPDRTNDFPILSADGTKITFHSDSDFLNQGISKFQNEIWLYDTTTMTLTRVTTASHPDRHSLSPSISADGTKITFHSDSDFLNQNISIFQTEIWLYDTTTMTVTRLTTASHPGRSSRSASLSADGTKLAFRSDSDFLNQGVPADQFEIWLYDTTMMTVTRVTSGSDSTQFGFFLSISADGNKVASASDLNPEIWLYNTSTMSVTQVTSASHPGRSSVFPSLSADGTKLAFHSDSDFLNQGIFKFQREIWLFDAIEAIAKVYLPVIIK